MYICNKYATMLRLLIKSMIFGLFVAGICFSSCKHETLAPSDVGYKYFPTNIGHWAAYNVDLTVWDDFYPVDSPQHIQTFIFDIKEIIESDFYDNENRLTQRIECYKKINDTTNWFLKDVWVSNLMPSTAEKVEENIRYVKLVFPIMENMTWNGNAFNTLGSQDYKYDNVFEPYTVNGVTFDSTVTVIQDIDTNIAIYEKIQFEVYAKNVGLIYRKFRDVEKNPYYPDSTVSGTDFTYRIKTFGN